MDRLARAVHPRGLSIRGLHLQLCMRRRVNIGTNGCRAGVRMPLLRVGGLRGLRGGGGGHLRRHDGAEGEGGCTSLMNSMLGGNKVVCKACR